MAGFNRYRLCTVVLAYAAAMATPFVASSTERIAVMELKAKSGIKQAQLDVLSDMLATEIRNLGGYEVVTKSDIESMLGLERAKEFIGCDDASCLAEIGGVLGVQYLVTGNVALFGGVYAINLKLIDIKHAKVKNSIFRKVHGGEAALLDDVPLAIRILLKREAPKQNRQPTQPPRRPPSRQPEDDEASSVIPASGHLSAKELEGRFMYLRYNLRYQRGGRGSCINYLTGKVVPAGTKVKIISVSNNFPRFITP